MVPFVSVIIPCFNEENYINRILDNVLEQDYQKDRMEVFVVDGNSKDRTQELILSKVKENPIIHLLINEKQYVPFARNLGISNASGEVIMFMDSHSSYPVNYISSLVDALYKLNADNVGGMLMNTAPDKFLTSTAIAIALSSPFGVGNAYFRIGSKTVKKVDTVTFGCYRRSVFDRIGLFDEELLRNADDEFNGRLIRHGGSIWLIPEIKITYYTRTSVKGLWKMYFQYGFFKPLVNVKLKKPATIRQFMPPGFVLFLFLFITGSFFSRWIFYCLTAGVCIYLLTNFLFSINAAVKSKRLLLLFFIPWLFLLLHIAYGWGYLAGIPKFVIFRGRKQTVSSNR